MEYFLIYLYGSAVAVVLSILKVAVLMPLAWITKGNILRKNLEKINPPELATSGQKAAFFAGALVFNAFLSWLAVASILLWEAPVGTFRYLRELLTSVPERIKLLRYPLRNNPSMSAEAVWAHVVALNQVLGADSATAGALAESLAETAEKVSSFRPERALDHLASLSAVDPGVVKGTRDRLATPR